MSTRKTVQITDMINEVNRVNQVSTLTPQHREGINLFLESFLNQNNVYCGFRYLEANELRDNAVGADPGTIVGFDRDGIRDNSLNTYPDETRRFYYTHQSLTK